MKDNGVTNVLLVVETGREVEEAGSCSLFISVIRCS
jgi:hypothetical protein